MGMSLVFAGIWSSKVFTIHLEEDMNVYSKCHGNLSNSLVATNKLVCQGHRGARGKVRGSLRSLGCGNE